MAEFPVGSNLGNIKHIYLVCKFHRKSKGTEPIRIEIADSGHYLAI